MACGLNGGSELFPFEGCQRGESDNIRYMIQIRYMINQIHDTEMIHASVSRLEFHVAAIGTDDMPGNPWNLHP